MSSRFATPLLLEKRRLDMIYFVRHCSSIKKNRGVYGIFILDILTVDSNFNSCNIHPTLAHCSLKYYNNKNNRTRITYFVRGSGYFQRRTLIYLSSLYTSVWVNLFSLIQFFKYRYTEVTFIGVKGYIFFCLLGSTGSHCFEIFCIWKLSLGDTMGVDKGTVSRCIRRVSHALAAKTDQFIKWPSD